MTAALLAIIAIALQVESGQLDRKGNDPGGSTFELLRHAMDSLDGQSWTDIDKFGLVLNSRMRECKSTEKRILFDRFEKIAIQILNIEIPDAHRARLANTLGRICMNQRVRLERSVHWHALAASASKKVLENEPENQQFIADYIQSLANQSEANWLIGRKREAFRILDLMATHVPKAESEADFIYLTFLAKLASQADKHAQAIEASKSILKWRNLSSVRRVRMHLNLAALYRYQRKLRLALVELEQTASLFSDLTDAERRSIRLRYATTHAFLLSELARFQKSLEMFESAISFASMEKNVTTGAKLRLQLGKAKCLSVLGRQLEAMEALKECDLRMPRHPTNVFEVRLAIDLKSRLSSAAASAGLPLLGRFHAVEGLALCRVLPESDELKLRHAIQKLTYFDSPLEERILLHSEESTLRDRLQNVVPAVKLHAELLHANLALEQGRAGDCEAICRRIISQIDRLPPAERTEDLQLIKLTCHSLMRNGTEVAGLSDQLADGILRVAIQPSTFNSYIAGLLYDNGKHSMADERLGIAFKQQTQKFLGSHERTIGARDTRAPVSVVAARIHKSSPKQNTIVAGSCWMDESESLVRLYAQSTAARNKRLGASDPTSNVASVLLPEIQQRLAESDVLVLYCNYRPEDAIERTCVFVVTRDDVERHELGPVWKYVFALRALAAKLETGQSDLKAAKEVGRLMGIPHLKLDQRKRLFVSGSSNGIPMAALVDADGRRVIEKVAVIHTSAMVALVNQTPPTKPKLDGKQRVLAVGDVDFGKPGKSDLFRVNWPPLPATKTEVESIAAAAEGRTVDLLSGRRATKREVLKAAQQANAIHFATHASVVSKAYSPFDPPIDPLKLSGVVLADANQAGPAAVLTGAEVCRMDLQNADMVVLAACETAMGADYADATTASLRQAFHVAGARNVISSHWRVDDEATAAFMKLLYANLWQDELPPHEAFRQAQLTLYHNPKLIPELARERGPNFKKVLRRTQTKKSASDRKTPVRLWAAFQFSGMGGLEPVEPK